MTEFDLNKIRQPLRVEKARAVNELAKQLAIATDEIARRMDLRPDEIAMALLGGVAMVLRNRGGAKVLPANLRSFAGKLHQYAGMLEKRDAQPTDEIVLQ